MKRKGWVLVILAGAVMGAGLRAEPTSRPFVYGPPPKTGGDTPESLGPGVTRAQRELDQIADRLMRVAEDQERSRDDRTNSFLLLGKIGTDKCLDFLIAHVGVHIPNRNMHLDYPASYALGEGGWSTAEAILRSLDEPRKRDDLVLMYQPFREILSKKVAVAVIDAELQRQPSDIRKANLEQLKEFLSH